MSNTPRTDAKLEELEKEIDRESLAWGYGRLVDFARELETEISTWKPIDTAPSAGKFLVWLPLTHSAWPAYGNHGQVVSNAHGTVNLKDDRHSPKATHWMPNPESPQ